MKERSGLSRYFPEGIHVFEEKGMKDYNRFDTFLGKTLHRLDCLAHPFKHLAYSFRNLDANDNCGYLKIGEFDFVERVFQFRQGIAQAIYDYTHIPDVEGLGNPRTVRVSGSDEGAEHESRNTRAYRRRGLITAPGEEL